MNLWLSIGIAAAGIALGYFIGQQHSRREYRDLTESMLDDGILLLKVDPDGFPNTKGVWEGRRHDLTGLLNKFEKEKESKVG